MWKSVKCKYMIFFIRKVLIPSQKYYRIDATSWHASHFVQCAGSISIILNCPNLFINLAIPPPFTCSLCIASEAASSLYNNFGICCALNDMLKALSSSSDDLLKAKFSSELCGRQAKVSFLVSTLKHPLIFASMIMDRRVSDKVFGQFSCYEFFSNMDCLPSSSRPHFHCGVRILMFLTSTGAPRKIRQFVLALMTPDHYRVPSLQRYGWMTL